jgi:hypothetical protein
VLHLASLGLGLQPDDSNIVRGREDHLACLVELTSLVVGRRRTCASVSLERAALAVDVCSGERFTKLYNPSPGRAQAEGGGLEPALAARFPLMRPSQGSVRLCPTDLPHILSVSK